MTQPTVGSLLILDKYELRAKIGEGAFSKVYRGKHIPSDQYVAIKMIAIGGAGMSEEETKKLMREVRVHKALKHPNILAFLEDGMEAGDQGYHQKLILVLGYAQGGDLFDKICPDFGMLEQFCHLYFKQLISALKYLHAQGIVHRDLKPENLLLTWDANLQICDFGLCSVFRYKGKERALGDACGSAPYVAPELAYGKPYRAEPIDIWSAGVVLFTMLVGNTPWDQPTSNSPEFAAYVTGELFQIDPWTRISHDVLNLLRRIMCVDASSRATIEDIRSDPWYRQRSPYLNDEGQVKNHNDVWDGVLSVCHQHGMFGMPEAPTAEGEFSQSKKDPVKPSVNMVSSKAVDDLCHKVMNKAFQAGGVSAVQSAHRQIQDLKAHNAPAGTYSNSLAKYSQVGSLAPSQAASGNLNRFVTAYPMPLVVSWLEMILQERLPNVKYALQPASDDGSVRFRIAFMDNRNVRTECWIAVMYEPTAADQAKALKDSGMDLDSDDEPPSSPVGQGEDQTITSARGSMQTGQGIGGGYYVVSMDGKGSGLERRRLMQRIIEMLPPGMVLAR